MGLPLDHFYRRYFELGQRACPNCDHDHIVIRWDFYKGGGWEWRCQECGQDWREPKITKGIYAGARAKKAKIAQEQPDSPHIIITEHKY